MESVQTGLLIDLDGTLANNLSIMRQVYGRFLAKYGHNGSDAEFAALNGPPLLDVVTSLVRTYGLPEQLETAHHVYCGFLKEAYRDVQPNTGAETLLQQAQSLGLRIAVVTSSEGILANGWLNQVGFGRYVDVVIGAGDALRGKPDPAPYQLALERMECQAESSFAVEDSNAGCRAALAAGLRTFMLASPSQIPPEGSIVIESLTEMADILVRYDNDDWRRE